MIENELAAKMMRGVLECNEELVKALREVATISEAELSKKIRRHIAHAMGNLLTEVMNPIGALYPNLYPEALRPAPKLRLNTKKGLSKKTVKTKRKRSST